MSGNYSRDQVMKVINTVIEKANPPQSETLRVIYEGLAVLARTIDEMHREIMATQSHRVGDEHIPSATDELDAVVGATAEASAAMMDAADAIQNIASTLPEGPQQALMNESTRIYEACSFQDITGQRITKVVKTLRNIEDSVDRLLGLFGPVDQATATIPQRPEDQRSEDEKLMNGPQLEDKAISQDDIDKLLAEFD